MKVLHIIPTQHLQGFAQAGFGERRHQHIDMNLAVMLIAGRLKFFQIKAVICISAENLGTIITANDDMLRLAGNDHSGEASHGLNPERNTAGRLAGFESNKNQSSLTPLCVCVVELIFQDGIHVDDLLQVSSY
jgi:hypothetical protein